MRSALKNFLHRNNKHENNVAASEGGGLLKRYNNNNNNKTAKSRKWTTDALRVVTLVCDDVDGDLSCGLVWTNNNTNTTNSRQGGSSIVLSKITGPTKYHPQLTVGLHLISINNVLYSDATAARQAIEECSAAGEPVTLLLGQDVNLKPPVTTTAGAGALAHQVSYPAAALVTARIYKHRSEAKTGLVLQTVMAPVSPKGGTAAAAHRRIVTIARLTHQAPRHLQVGMRLVSVENATWFTHHTEAVALIRSWPAQNYLSLLLVHTNNTTNNTMKNNGNGNGDSTCASTVSTLDDSSSVATGMSLSYRSGGSDGTSLSLDTTSHQQQQQYLTYNNSNNNNNNNKDTTTTTNKNKETTQTDNNNNNKPRLIFVTLTPAQAAQVLLTDNDEESGVFVYDGGAGCAQLAQGQQVVHVNGQALASAGHYEHALQTTEEDVTLCVSVPVVVKEDKQEPQDQTTQQDPKEDDNDSHKSSSSSAPTATNFITATATKTDATKKTGLILANDTNGNHNISGVLITRIAQDSIFAPTPLQANTRLISINQQTWFQDYQDAIAIIRSLPVGEEITIVTTAATTTVVEKEKVEETPQQLEEENKESAVSQED